MRGYHQGPAPLRCPAGGVTSIVPVAPALGRSTCRGEDKMAYLCPTCNCKILSRRNKLCGFCREALPAELLLTPAEVGAIEAAERERALARELSEKERLEAARKASYGWDYSGG